MSYQQETWVAIGLLVLVSGLVGVLLLRVARSREVHVSEDLPIAAPHETAPVIAAQALHRVRGLRVDAHSPASFRLVRKVIPTWSVVFLLLGIVGVVLMFLVREDRVATAEVLDGPDGPVLRVIGPLDRAQATALRAALAATPARA